jgi:SAM-dependent methyltransferase
LERSIFDIMAENSDHHWWWLSRRRLVSQMIRELKLPADAKILEIGCGSGADLEELGQYGKVHGLEQDPEMLKIAQGRQIADVRGGQLPDQIPFNEKFDLIVLLDVLEHIQDDARSLEAIRNALAPGGVVLITVPAFQFLWSKFDEVLHHHRRYVQDGMDNLLQSKDFSLIRASYFNTILFPVAFLVRLINRMMTTVTSTGLKKPLKIVNIIMMGIASFERRLIKTTRLPFGTSLIVVAKKGFES